MRNLLIFFSFLFSPLVFSQGNNPSSFIKKPHTTLTAGLQHACYIYNGAARCWGGGTAGQTGVGARGGLGQKLPSGFPYTQTVVGLESGVSEIAAGSSHNCAIQNEGVKCWGSNTDGQLGDGTNVTRYVPVSVPGLSSGVTKISASGNRTCAIQNGAVKCWGRALLGDGTSDPSTSPVSVSGLGTNVTEISVGGSHSCAIQNGALKCWGENGSNQLADSDTSKIALVPEQITGLTSGVREVSSGAISTCVIHNSAAKCWGDGSNGRLGNGSTVNRVTPTQVTGLTSNVYGINAGAHACAIHNQRIKCWGKNDVGQLGNNTTSASQLIPVLVSNISTNVSAVVTESTYSCGIVKGIPHCWGDDISGSFRLGQEVASSLVPVKVRRVGEVSISLSGTHACGIFSGAAKCWGTNNFGQLGDGTTQNSSLPVQVSGLTSGVTSISTGDTFSCAVHRLAVKCWGNNSGGRLGIGGLSPSFSTTPLQVDGLTSGYSHVTSGNMHSCVAAGGFSGESGSQIACWGTQNHGQIGNGNLNSVEVSPVGISTTSRGSLDISTGGEHTCYQDLFNKYCWGANTHGQLGLGDTTDRSTKTEIPVLDNNDGRVVAGSSHTCVVRDTGQVQCWGLGSFGRLGNGGTGSQSVPTNTSGLSSGVSLLGVGSEHTCAIENGSLKCWGRGLNGRIGDGTTSNRPSPTNVVNTPSTIFFVATGKASTCMIDEEGLHCWGLNTSGELSLGNTTGQYLSPQDFIGAN